MDNSNVFKLNSQSQEIDVKTLNLFDHQMKIGQNKEPKIFFQPLVKQKRPLLETLKPYLKTIGTGASTIGFYGFRLLQSAGNLLSWGFSSIKNAVSKIEPKFIFYPINNTHLNVDEQKIEESIQSSLTEIYQLPQINELKEKANGKYQVVVVPNEQFRKMLEKEKYKAQKQWEPKLDSEDQVTKTIMLPSESFEILLDQYKQEDKEVPKKVYYDYGDFCKFEFEEKNEIEKQFFFKLNNMKGKINGVLLPVQKVKSVSEGSSEGFPSASDNPLISDLQIPGKVIPKVVQIKPLYASISNSEQKQVQYA